MKKLSFIMLFFASILLQSCYAYLKAEKMIYSGTIAKKQPTVTIQSDSTSVVYATE